jgi:predicted DNA binding CopG/RHH family protein
MATKSGKPEVIKCEVTPDVKATFRDEAKKRNMTEAALLRSLIIGLSENQPQKVTFEVETEIHRFTLRLPKILFSSAKIKAEKKGMTLTKWIESLIQVAITRNTVLSESEFSILRESNRNLLAIGRNLNQIAKSINANLKFAIENQLLEELLKIIKENSNAIHSSLKASHNAWGEE